MKELLVAIAVMSFVGLAGAPPGVTVRMTSRDTFVPKTLTIKVGDTVVWENDSPGVHTVTDNSAGRIGEAGCVSACRDGAVQLGTDRSWKTISAHLYGTWN